MFGLRHIKAPPTLWLLHYRSGRLVRQGAGISFFYFAPSAVLAAVPVNVQEADFVFSALSSDFQEISVQGSVHFRIDRPEECAQHLDFALDERGRSNPETLEQLRNRLAGAVQVVAAEALQRLLLLQLPLLLLHRRFRVQLTFTNGPLAGHRRQPPLVNGLVGGLQLGFAGAGFQGATHVRRRPQRD